jgi:hypothetical protein
MKSMSEEDYQAYTESRVFSQCPECQEYWDECRCSDEE